MSSPSIIDKLLDHQSERKKQEEQIIERMEEWKEAINRMFETNEGRMFAKYWLKSMGLFRMDSTLNPAQEIENRGMKAFYLRHVRPSLDRKIIMEIETQ